MVKPEDLLFSETHEWVRLEADGDSQIATVGITAFAVEQLTDLVYMELPEIGSQVSSGGEFGEVESVKAVSPMYSPVDGEVLEVNSELVDRLETLGRDPYEAGWLMRVRLSDSGSLAKLMDYAAYQKQCAEEGH